MLIRNLVPLSWKRVFQNLLIKMGVAVQNNTFRAPVKFTDHLSEEFRRFASSEMGR